MSDESDISIVYDESVDKLEYEASIDIDDRDTDDNDTDDDDTDDAAEDYRVISFEEITKMMNNVIKDVTDVVKLPESLVRVLLNGCDWDKEKLYEKYFSDDYSGVMSQINALQNSNDQMMSTDEQLMTNCMICFSEEMPTQMASLQCGHQYCVDCWRQYITTKINESVANGISCPDNDCKNYYVNDSLVDSLIDDKSLIDRYRKLMSNSFIVNHKYLRCCAYPDCSYAIQVNRIKFQSIKCFCGHRFCFECSEVWHEPTRCDLLKMWRIKCQGSDNDSLKWIIAYTKECPKCKAQIEKNGGCNHMSCSRCRHQFCWLCLNDWNCHQYQSCNKFDALESNKESARLHLERYVHYWTRFNNHENSLNAEKTMGNLLREQLDKLIVKGITCVDTNYVSHAAEVLCNCRQTLMFSYPFAFYVFNSNQAQIFDENQSNLELMTEKLSRNLEAIHKDINNLKLLKADILDETNYCEKRCKVLVEHVNEGYDKEFWHFYSFD